MRNYNPSEQMDAQLNQVFKYAEMIHRIEQSLDILDDCGDYIGKSSLKKNLTQTRNALYASLGQHFKNSDVKETTLHIIMRVMSEVLAKEEDAKFKVGDAWSDMYSYYEIVFIPNSDEIVGGMHYIVRDSGHDGIRYFTYSEEDLEARVSEMERVVGGE